MEQPCINIASPYIGSEYEVYRQQDFKSKQNWLTQEGFKNQCQKGGDKEKFIDNHYVTADPSEPPMLHRFRQEDKETFLFGQFKSN